MRLRRITNQEKKITGLLKSLRRNELNCHVVCLAKKRQVVVSCEILLQKVESSSSFCKKTCTSVPDPGEAPPPPLFLDQNEARRAEKIFVWDCRPHLSQGLDDDRACPLIWRSGSDTVHVGRLTGSRQTCCNSYVWRDSYVILSSQRLVFTQLATVWFAARQA